MNKNYNIAIIIILLILATSLSVYVVYYYTNSLIQIKYSNLLSNRNSKNKDTLCPKGCDKGVCRNIGYCSIDNMINSKCCVFNYQCHDCKDGDNVYKYPKNYTEYKKNNTNLLNEKIKLQNKNINEINKIIDKNNK